MSPRNVVPRGSLASLAISSELPLLYPPAQNVPHLPGPTGSTADRGKCQHCASPCQAWLLHGSEALALLDMKLQSNCKVDEDEG